MLRPTTASLLAGLLAALVACGAGPTFRGIFGRQQTMADGAALTVDEDYIRESILDPGARIVSGYGPIMPSFRELVGEVELESLILFLKGLD